MAAQRSPTGTTPTMFMSPTSITATAYTTKGIPTSELRSESRSSGSTRYSFGRGCTTSEHRERSEACGFSPFTDDTSTARDTAFAKIRSRVEETELASLCSRSLSAAPVISAAPEPGAAQWSRCHCCRKQLPKSPATGFLSVAWLPYTGPLTRA